MSDFGKPVQPEHLFLKIVWRRIISISKGMEPTTTWTVAGIAAILGFCLGNLESIGEIVSRGGLRWFVILLTVSMLLGVFSKLVGMALSYGLDLLPAVERDLSSPEAIAAMSRMKIPPEEFGQRVAEPFLWPLNRVFKKAARQGMHDYLHGERKFVWMFCIQLYSNLFHLGFAATAFVVLACNIKTVDEVPSAPSEVKRADFKVRGGLMLEAS